ncbi:Hpt domain-containing protein [Alteriqipengyuania sp. WL0013]|uniref:Hpt domain-containing protein n=1 Tax=Alteriqipengyuania sp. WL0013 TaxID=3110773 RepID=UPI002BD7CF21|nr:Hpt domain-containing protein [Alteriqipengyuania sp. WL0013]MEB3416799.1 Hpt domain-containing protein [Alteriqipengyuania sp. WL0013]
MTDVANRMAQLAGQFAARAADERARLAVALAASDRASLQEQAHKLAGIAGMFGHPRIGEAALELEEAAEGGFDVSAPGAELDSLLAELQRC